MAGDHWQKLANLRALYAYMWAHPGKKLLFMGGELAQEAEWSHERSLDWHLLEREEHAGIQRLGRAPDRPCRQQPPLWAIRALPGAMWWPLPHIADQNVNWRARRSPTRRRA